MSAAADTDTVAFFERLALAPFALRRLGWRRRRCWWHVSAAANRASILRHGLLARDPCYDPANRGRPGVYVGTDPDWLLDLARDWGRHEPLDVWHVTVPDGAAVEPDGNGWVGDSVRILEDVPASLLRLARPAA